MSGTGVLLVTVSYRSGPYVESFLNSAQQSPVETAVVANNAPDDHALDEIVNRYLFATIHESGRNLGYGGAVNDAVQATPASPAWLLVANPDLQFEEGAIAELVHIGESDPRIGVVGPQILTPAGIVYPSARRLPTLRTGIGHALFSRVWRTNPWTRAYLADTEGPVRQRDAGWLSGSCMLIRREAFDAVAGFDPRYFMYFEDVDICARIGGAGWRIVYAPSAVVTHVGAHATSATSARMTREHHRSAYLYLARRYQGWYFAPLRLALKLALRMRAQLARR